MERHAGFVRNIMIGREGMHRTVLLDCFRNAGARDPRSYLATGNVTFTADDEQVDAIRRVVEHELERVVRRRTEVAFRSIPYLTRLAASKPFAAIPVRDAIEHEVSFTFEPIDPDALALPTASSGGHLTVVAATPGEIFSVGREVDGRRKGAGGFVERMFGQRVTTRAWRTVMRVVDDPA